MQNKSESTSEKAIEDCKAGRTDEQQRRQVDKPVPV